MITNVFLNFFLKFSYDPLKRMRTEFEQNWNRNNYFCRKIPKPQKLEMKILLKEKIQKYQELLLHVSEYCSSFETKN